MRVFTSRRRAISEVLGTVLTASMTIIAGAAIFGYVNGQAGTASQAYGQAVGGSVDYLNEKFAVVDVAWGTASCGTGTCATATVWVYNTGKVQLTLLQVRLYDSARTVDLLYNYTTVAGTAQNRIHDLLSTGSSQCGIGGGSYENPTIRGNGSFLASISHTAVIELYIPPASAAPGQTCPSYGQSISASDTYYFNLVGTFGNTNTYSQLG